MIKIVRNIAVAYTAAALFSGVASAQSVDLTGAGATFPYPIYSKWFNDYAQSSGVKINYQSIGSGGGIRQLSEQTVDFGASDSPMSDQELANAKGGPVLHFPTVMGAVVITYNVPGIAKPLNLSGDVIADIFSGKIAKWNDNLLRQTLDEVSKKKEGRSPNRDTAPRLASPNSYPVQRHR